MKPESMLLTALMLVGLPAVTHARDPGVNQPGAYGGRAGVGALPGVGAGGNGRCGRASLGRWGPAGCGRRKGGRTPRGRWRGRSGVWCRRPAGGRGGSSGCQAIRQVCQNRYTRPGRTGSGADPWAVREGQTTRSVLAQPCIPGSTRIRWTEFMEPHRKS